MSMNRRIGVLAVAASLTLTALAVPATGIAAGIVPDSGVQAVSVPTVGETTPPELVPAGKLELSTTNGTPGSGAVKRLDLNGEQVGETQTLTESGSESCRTLGSAGGALLKFDGVLNSTPGKPVGFSKGSIGVKETSNETFCNQIDTTSIWTPVAETLVLALPASLADGFGPLRADAASLDVELRSSNSRILATASLGGTPVAYYELNTGTFQNNTPLIPGTNPLVTKSGMTSPGNVQWSIGDVDDSVTFDTLSIRAYKGAISLEGGGDGAPTGPTTIDLLGTAEEVLDCTNPSRTEGTTTATFVGNAGSGDGCTGEGFGVVLTNGENSTELLKPLDVDPDAQFVFDLEWTEAANTVWESDSPLVKRTTADFDGDGGNPPVTIAWCPDLVETTVGDDTFLVVDNVGGNPALVDQAPGFPTGGDTKQFACIISQKPTLDSTTDTLTIVEQVYVYGDIKLVR